MVRSTHDMKTLEVQKSNESKFDSGKIHRKNKALFS